MSSLVQSATTACDSGCLTTVTAIVKSTIAVPANVTFYDFNHSTSINFASYWSSLHAVSSATGLIHTTDLSGADPINGTQAQTVAALANNQSTSTGLPLRTSYVTNIVTSTSTVTIISTTGMVTNLTNMMNANVASTTSAPSQPYSTLNITTIAALGFSNVSYDVVPINTTMAYNTTTVPSLTSLSIHSVTPTIKPSMSSVGHPSLSRSSSSAASPTSSSAGNHLKPPRCFLWISAIISASVNSVKADSSVNSAQTVSSTTGSFSCPANEICITTTINPTVYVTLNVTSTTSSTSSTPSMYACVAPACLTEFRAAVNASVPDVNVASPVSRSWIALVVAVFALAG